MTVNELLVRRLLADEKIVNFEDNAVFRNEIAGQTGAVSLLLGIMRSGPERQAGRAAEMLCFFPLDSLPEIAQALLQGSTDWQLTLLMILWTILAPLDARERQALFEPLSPHLAPLLGDRTPVPQPATESPVEHELDYRLCDEAYVLLQFLHEPNFDEELFRSLPDYARDGAIRNLVARTDLVA